MYNDQVSEIHKITSTRTYAQDKVITLLLGIETVDRIIKNFALIMKVHIVLEGPNMQWQVLVQHLEILSHLRASQFLSP